MKRANILFTVSLTLTCLVAACVTGAQKKDEMIREKKIKVILDTDANNELDDQHAIAYMLFNRDFFDIKGITVNETRNGGSIEKHVEEARRVVNLCGFMDKIRVIPGASGNYTEIRDSLDEPDYDGHEAVEFIIDEARQAEGDKLVLVPIGKLTNIALALEKAPDIARKVKVIWLGSNWPDEGEYNLENDTSALAPLLMMDELEFEILTVRYGKASGTWAVSLSVEEVRRTMKGLGPRVEPVEGRHGGSFDCFGDYSVELYDKIGDEIRPIYDVCTLVLLKYPEFADKVAVKGVSFDGTSWQQTGLQDRTIIFLENFNKEKIIEEFFSTMKNSKKLHD
ncbi:MAG TPA: nucleoside hydrolase [Bacteroidetes bacterium]|nr:nucleoside hydrolase [Bacteroidota bacterium]